MNYIFNLCPPLQDMVANVRCIHVWRLEKGINMTFKNFIQMIVKIHEIVLFTRATPGSSLVHNNWVHSNESWVLFLYGVLHHMWLFAKTNCKVRR